MSGLIISNDLVFFENLYKSHLNSGFVLFKEERKNGVYIASFKKRVKDICSFKAEEDGSYIFSSGSFVYHNETGESALGNILNEFSNVKEVRDELIGNYAMAVTLSGETTLFTDPYGIYDIFYYENAGKFAVSTSLSSFASVFSEVKINKSALFSETILAGYIGNESIFEGVYKLRGVEEIALSKDSFKIKTLPYCSKKWDFSNLTIEDAVEQYKDLIVKYTSKVSSIWGDNMAIHQTGGLDNRLIFSAFANTGKKPQLIYGQGNSILTTTDNEDRDCVLEYAEKFKLNAHIMDWSHGEGSRGIDMWEQHFRRYGFKFSIYGAPVSFFEEYEGKIPKYPDFFEFGYYGENLRLREFLDGVEYVDTDVFFESYLFGGGGGYGIINDDDFLPDSEYIKNKLKLDFINEAKLHGVDIGDKIYAKDFDRVRWVHARKADSRSLNFINEFAPSIAMLSIPELHEFPWSLPAEWRKNGEFQLRVIHSLCPKALEVPIFSHGKLQTLKKDEYSLKIKYTVAERIKFILESVKLPNKVVRSIANIYHNYFQLDRGKASALKSNSATMENAQNWILSYLEEDVSDQLRFVNPKNYKGHIVGLHRYAIHIYALDKFLNVKND
ncbi:hypothetical protein [Marinomonas arenicola]|uniref:Uncharacterized protein n=1 Tax=Marinomonas arenicola TaxID=569601 RepID=A0ABU9G8N6_9GAMM